MFLNRPPSQEIRFYSRIILPSDYFIYMGHIMRKPVFGVSDQVRLKPGYVVSEVSWSPEILDIETGGIILSRKRTTKALTDCMNAQADLRLCCLPMAKQVFS